MRVVHAPSEIAGQMGILCQGLRRAGVKVNGYNWFRSYISYRNNIIDTDAYELARIFDPLLAYCDLFHFHNGNSLLTENRDLPFIAKAGKKMVMQHWGNDVRAANRVSRLNPYPLPPSYLSDEQIHERLVYMSRYIDTAIVQDYEVYPYVCDYYKHVHVLPLACDVSKFTPSYPSPDQQVPMIVHAPTNRAFKGSTYVEQAVERLKQRSVPFDYRAVEKLSNREALQIYAACDILIDQVLCGSYGMVSVEAMALGKVVVAFIRDDVRAKMPDDLPIVIATPDNLADVLHHLIIHPELRHKIGKAGRAFVEKHHAVERVVKKLLSIYKNL